MGFEGILVVDSGRDGFGTQRYLATGKERPHISKSKIAAHDDSEYLKLGESKFVAYTGWTGKRYLAFENLSYDLMVSLYDVDTQKGYGIRLFETKGLVAEVAKGVRSVASRRPNIEARVVGLQNKEDHGFLNGLLSLLSKEGIRLIEVDLFGEEVRHIAIDLKTGMSLNLLLEDRHYRPGELINKLTIDDFSRTLVKPKE
ncbi:MAG: hypothetical protein KGH94_00870 [Candidatus Micrarchaeota archaeon]|nr:hypothetical protein [Candidatus Micrarchaeota archaeon]